METSEFSFYNVLFCLVLRHLQGSYRHAAIPLQERTQVLLEQPNLGFSLQLKARDSVWRTLNRLQLEAD